MWQAEAMEVVKGGEEVFGEEESCLRSPSSPRMACCSFSSFFCSDYKNKDSNKMKSKAEQQIYQSNHSLQKGIDYTHNAKGTVLKLISSGNQANEWRVRSELIQAHSQGGSRGLIEPPKSR